MEEKTQAVDILSGTPEAIKEFVRQLYSGNEAEFHRQVRLFWMKAKNPAFRDIIISISEDESYRYKDVDQMIDEFVDISSLVVRSRDDLLISSWLDFLRQSCTHFRAELQLAVIIGLLEIPNKVKWINSPSYLNKVDLIIVELINNTIDSYPRERFDESHLGRLSNVFKGHFNHERGRDRRVWRDYLLSLIKMVKTEEIQKDIDRQHRFYPAIYPEGTLGMIMLQHLNYVFFGLLRPQEAAAIIQKGTALPNEIAR